MDPEVPCGVTLAFTERTGGFSEGEFSSLNLGSRCGDNLQQVQKNRQLVLEALGAGEHFSRLLIPHQVHGSNVVCLTSDTPEAFEQAKTEAEAGAD
ncbi:MAG: laccase domain-containing protein, partial [Atopobium sp.]|nr:laccase domain-containing protein [Atopobium sp.]